LSILSLQPLTELVSHSEALGRSGELRFVNIVLDVSKNEPMQ